MAPSEQVAIPELPLPLRWLGLPQAWESGEGALRISAGPRSDLFVDPAGSISTGLETPPMLVCIATPWEWHPRAGYPLRSSRMYPTPWTSSRGASRPPMVRLPRRTCMPGMAWT